MANTSTFLQRLLLVLASFCVFSSAHAAGSSYDQAPNLTTYNVQNGVLMGINDLEYNGQFYNVTFKTGSCDSVFSGCNPASMVFASTNNSLVALNGATALAEAMFYYDKTSPFTTVNGCANESCYINTPTGINASTGGITTAAINQWLIVGQGELTTVENNKMPDELVIAINRAGATASGNLPSTQTYAVWTPVTSPLPETSTWAMMAAGVLMLAFVTRKAKQSR